MNACEATMTTATTDVRPAKLPGPNQPCWCGSGEKYKKCHRDKDAAVLPAAEPPRRPVRLGQVSPRRDVPPEIPRPDYAETGKPVNEKESPLLTPEQIERMRRACQAAAQVLAHTGSFVAPGVTTDKLDEITHAEYIRLGGYPSTLNYHGFPKSLCTSVNEVVCHGIPDSRPLEEGDIVNLDITIFLDGMHGDTSATFLVGKVDEASKQLVRVTRESLLLGIEAVKPGLPLNVIGRAIESHVSKYGYSIVRRYLGHGIGTQFHSDLHVPHHYDPKANTIMEPGMVFTIEPMIAMGTWQVDHWKDDWTVVTIDGKRSAQFEHTVLVTDTGVEVLTENPKVFGVEL
jgi:methionyl aminopeptidase